MPNRTFELSCLVILSLLPSALKAAEPAVAGKTVQEWQKQLDDPSETARLQAIAALSQAGPAAKDALLVSQNHKEESVRHWAAVGLGKIGSQKDLPREAREQIVVVLAIRMQDKAATVRISAAAAMARCGQVEPALPVLTAALKDPIPGARIQAAFALDDLGEDARPALPAIREAKEDSTDYVVRLATRILNRLEQ